MLPRETKDPWGRRVVLTSTQWVHVVEEHPQMLALMNDVLDTVGRPEVITPDPKVGRWRYWRSAVGPSRWLFVVVMWNADEPSIVTAYPKRKGPVV